MALSSKHGNAGLHELSRQALQRQINEGRAGASSTAKKNTHVAFARAATVEENPKIPDPGLFNFEHENQECFNARLPTIAECAAHLELLQAFRHVRLKVRSSTTLDTVLGIIPAPRTVYRRKFSGNGRGYSSQAVKVRDETFKERRQAKWPFYLALAAARFLRWARIMEEGLVGPTTSNVDCPHLPPIDILMVWHALLLNPSWAWSFEAQPLDKLLAIPFPWKETHEAIGAEERDWPYNLPEDSVNWFKNNHLASDLFESLVGQTLSPRVQEVLAKKGVFDHGEDTGRSLATFDVDRVLSDSADLSKLEICFLECCRDAVDDNTTVTKLVDAVQRQASFVDKMDRQLWIRSPAPEGILSRAINRYSQFMRLFKLYPKTMLVPTLDIDLIWHTHQCSPSQYQAGTSKMADRIIDHDDKLGKDTLGLAFTRTKDLYRIRFGKNYEVCNCWDCEALRSAVNSQDSYLGTESRTIARLVHETVAYHRAVEIARQKGDRLLPIRTN